MSRWITEQVRPLQTSLTESWREQAACTSADPDLFYDGGASTVKAKKLCVSCPVRQQCLDTALAATERFGIWGGMTPIQRRVYELEHSSHRVPQASLERARQEAAYERQMEEQS